MILKDLLDHESSKDLTIINRKADLNREVSTIESTETPDVISYVPVNSFIITTGMIYKDHQDKLRELILQLDSLPCSGLGIKLGRFINELEPETIETADRVKFPLICIPMNRTLGEVYHCFLAILWNSENKDLLNTLNVQKKFYNLIRHDVSLKRLLNAFSSTIKKHVAVVDIFGEICGTSNTDYKEEKICTQIIKQMKNEENEDAEYWYRSFSESGEKKEVYIYPIRSNNRNTHYMIVFGNENAMPVSAFVMEEILLVFSIHFYKKLYAYYNEIQFRNSFLKMITFVNGNEVLSIGQVVVMGREYGLRDSGYYCTIAARFVQMDSRRFQGTQFTWREEKYILVYNYLKRKIEVDYSGDVIVLPDIDGWKFIFLVQNKRDKLDEKLKDIRNTLYRVFKENMIFSYGSIVHDAGSIVDSYWEATERLDNIVTEPKSGILYYQPQNILDFLRGVSRRHINEICKNMLKELAFPGDETNKELQRTLKAYLDCRCNIMETANRLYLHRNTVRYRIKKCEEILGNDLSDWDYCIQLRLCLILLGTQR